MQLCGEFDVSHVCFESDCFLLVNKLRLEITVLGELGNLFKRIKELCSSFEECKFSYARRQANKVAHSLAQLKLITESTSCFTFQLPEHINVILCKDLE